MNTEAAKDVIMGRLTNGKFISELYSALSVVTAAVYAVIHCCMNIITYSIFFLFCSALGGSHGVPRVHYKGRQGDYYIMV